MKLKTCILTILLINTTNIAEAGKTSFYNKLEKQNRRNLQKLDQKNKKTQKLDNDVSTLLFLSTLYSYINAGPKDKESEDFLSEFENEAEQTDFLEFSKSKIKNDEIPE